MTAALTKGYAGGNVVRRRTLALCVAAGLSLGGAPREARAQVFRLFAPGALATTNQSSATADPSGGGRHAVIALTRTPMAMIGFAATITTPATGITPPTWLAPALSAGEATQPSIGFLGSVPLIAWRQGAPGAHSIVLDLGGVIRTVTASNCSPPAVACSPTRCVVVYQTPDGSLGGRSIDATATVSPLSIRAGSMGAADAVATTLVPAAVHDEASNTFVTAAVLLASGTRQVQVFQTTFLSPTSTMTTALFSSSALAEPPSLTRHNGETLLAHRTSTNIQVQRLTGATRVGSPLQVPGTGSSFLPSIASGPRGALLAFIDRAGGAQRPTVLRFTPSATPIFSTVRPTALVGELADRVTLSSHSAAPLLVWDAPAAGASMATVRALYLDNECVRDDDCGLRLGGSLPTQCGTCDSGACMFPVECISSDASTDASTDASSDASSDSGTDAGTDGATDGASPMDGATDASAAPDAGVLSDGALDVAALDSREGADAADGASDATAADASFDAQSRPNPPQYRGGACACRAATTAPDHRMALLLGAAALIVCARRRSSRARRAKQRTRDPIRRSAPR